MKAVALLILLSAGIYGQNVPNPHLNRAERFGAYHWNIDYSYMPAGGDKLEWGNRLVKATGSHVVRAYLGDSTYVPPAGPYDANPPENPDDADYLVRIAKTRQYSAMFSDRDFSTYLLTVYTTADNLLKWAEGYDDDAYEYERTRICRLAEHLIQNYPDKTFIILNWEGDHHFNRYYEARFNFVRWIQSRADGVAAARQRAGGGEVYSGLEVNRIGDDNVASFVGSRVAVDYISYSSWMTVTSVLVDGGNMASRLCQDVDWLLAQANNRAVPDGIVYLRRNVIIGEYGLYRDGFGATPSIAFELFDAIEAMGASYAIWWQVADETTGQPGLYTPAGDLTYSGLAFKDGLAGLQAPHRRSVPMPHIPRRP
jgi:hypothetical protein